nr:hypothetical protein [Tanacetum cinerariifolium]
VAGRRLHRHRRFAHRAGRAHQPELPAVGCHGAGRRHLPVRQRAHRPVGRYSELLYHRGYAPANGSQLRLNLPGVLA